jgi:hypothetical protein
MTATQIDGKVVCMMLTMFLRRSMLCVRCMVHHMHVLAECLPGRPSGRHVRCRVIARAGHTLVAIEYNAARYTHRSVGVQRKCVLQDCPEGRKQEYGA